MVIQILFRFIGAISIAFAVFWASENGENFLKEQGFYLDNKILRSTIGIDDRLPKELEENKNLLEDDSPILGVIDMNSFVFMLSLIVGMILLCIDSRDIFDIFKQVFLKFPSKILRDEENIEKSLRKASEGYYSQGGSSVSQTVEVKSLPVWPLILKQLEVKMPFSDIQLMMGNSAATTRKEFDRHIRILSTVANFIPSLGVVGTVLGLIKLLFNMDAFANIGPAMALALMTTFYGLLFSVIIFRPMCMRLEGLKIAIMRLYQTAGFWLVILEQRKPGFYVEQDYINKNKKK